MIAVIYGHRVPTTSFKFQEVILLMAIIGIFFGSDTGNTENIAKIVKRERVYARMSINISRAFAARFVW